MEEIKVLQEFLSVTVESSDPVLERFGNLPRAVCRDGGEGRRFVYVPGSRKDRVVLVAHADTVWTPLNAVSSPRQHRVVQQNGTFRSYGSWSGLGADDRAGCAILWLLKDFGHSLLVTDGEEKGRRGSHFLAQDCPDIYDEINGTHGFMVQFDRRHASDFKCYEVGTDSFREYVAAQTGYSEPDRKSFTDICTLCRDICGVNLSVGYYHEHSPGEFLVIEEWLNTLNLCRNWLGSGNLPRFPLNNR
uniref:Peptidase M28 domain-containing protein n=1 Tax=Desulfacinum infernum TaxID=35837 RepID=A0A832EDR6_9BACT